MRPEIDWDDLDAEQKAALDEEDVRAYCMVAAVEAGVVLTKSEPDFAEEDKPELNYQTAFAVEAEHMPEGIVFGSREDAEKFCQLDVVGVDRKYLGSGWADSIKVRRVLAGRRVKVVDDIVTEGEYERLRSELNEYGEAVKHNKELRNKIEKRQSAYDRATEYIWSDWREARDRARDLQEVRRCWGEYLDLAKDQASAIACMYKAYDDKALLKEALGEGWDCLPAEPEHATLDTNVS